MAYVITKLCRDCKDIACTQVCPVDCIYEYTGDDPTIPKSQLLIDPDECINCNACVPECPGKQYLMKMIFLRYLKKIYQ
jgi:ferredoxin